MLGLTYQNEWLSWNNDRSSIYVYPFDCRFLWSWIRFTQDLRISFSIWTSYQTPFQGECRVVRNLTFIWLQEGNITNGSFAKAITSSSETRWNVWRYISYEYKTLLLCTQGLSSYNNTRLVKLAATFHIKIYEFVFLNKMP